jgi:hypothetical protein
MKYFANLETQNAKGPHIQEFKVLGLRDLQSSVILRSVKW